MSKNENDVGCLGAWFVYLGIGTWAFGAIIVGLGVWEKTSDLIQAIGSGVAWPTFIPFMILNYIK